MYTGQAITALIAPSLLDAFLISALLIMGGGALMLLAIQLFGYIKDRSNCHIEAWRRFMRGEADWIHIRETEYSKASRLPAWAVKMLWPLRVLARLWTPAAHVQVQLCHYCRTGNWLHIVWRDSQTGHVWEFVADPDFGDTLLPPPLFRGRIQRAEGFTTTKTENNERTTA